MRLRVLGGFDFITVTGDPAPDVARQTRLMLAVLAIAGPKGITRAEFCALFWPDRAPPQARNSLRQGLAAVRKALAAQGGRHDAIEVLSDLETVRLSYAPATIDVHAFWEGLKQGGVAGWISAAEAYGGDLLAGIEFSDSLELWLESTRRLLKQQALDLAERMSKVEDTGAHVLAAAQSLAERLLSTAPAAEEAHRSLIRVQLRLGRPNAALRQFELCKAALQAELQAEPDPETVRLFASIQAFDRHSASEIKSTETHGPMTLSVARDQPSVAIMPFDNLGAEADAYFADGVVEEITSALSRIRDFFVIARQSAFTYKGKFVDVKEVGRELGVDYVIEGTVRRAGDRLRISVQLVDTGTRAQLWSDRYEGSTSEIFEFQDRIAVQVAGAMHPAIRRAEIEAAKRKPPSNLGAYDLVMRAYPKLWGQNAAAIGDAMTLLREALTLDGSYGRAHALLAWCHGLNATYIWSSMIDAELEAARSAVDAATGLIEDDPTALTAAGAAIGFCGDQQGASALIERAITLDPNNAWAWARWGWTGVYRGQPDQALERFERAMRLSPLDPFAFNTRMGIGAAYALSGRLVEAVNLAQDVIKTHRDVTWAYRQLAAWSAMAGDLQTARSAARSLLAAHPEFSIQRYLALPTFKEVPEFRAKMAAGLRAAGLPEE